MKILSHILYTLIILLIACTSSEKSSQEGDNSYSSKSSDFIGKLELTIDGESYEFSDMTRTDSRVSFQDNAIAVYVANPKGEGTIAQITILSPKIYESNSHIYVNESNRWLEKGDTREPPKRTEQNLRFKFRKIDKMDSEEYLMLDQGTVQFKYNDEEPIFEMTFEGKDTPSAHNREEDKEIQFSGKLTLKGAYLMDSRH